MRGLKATGQDQFIKRLLCVAAGPGSVVRILPEGAAELTERNGHALGVAYLPRERRGESLFESMSIRENFALPTLAKDRRGGLLDTRSMARRFDAFARFLVPALRRRARCHLHPVRRQPAESASGVRGLPPTPRSCFLMTPPEGSTSGPSGRSTQSCTGSAEKGMSVVILSSEVDELVGLADRVLLFR